VSESDTLRPGRASALASQQTPEMASAPSSSAPHIRIVSTGADAADVAAVTAVLTAALDELAASQAADTATPISAWQRGQRQLRTPLMPGPGAWRSFSG
jgi:hypothetical protein